MPDFWTAVAAIGLLIWLYLALFHGRFWRADQRLPARTVERQDWPEVTVVVPARDEADVVGAAIGSLLDQSYRGPLGVVVVDDRSRDGTADAARAAAGQSARPDGLTLVAGKPLPDGWTGKLWAVAQGIDAIDSDTPFLLLTDADIVHAPDNVARLVDKAERDRLDMVSLMVLLHCRTIVEKLFIPAFVYFFQQVYPFPESNRPGSRVAAAAGGCILARRDALARAGGIGAIKGELIDDCALARRIKRNGATWIGLTDETRSIRPYRGLGDIWRMVVRTAYTQLNYSPFQLAGTIVGMTLAYLGPPVAVLAGILVGNVQAAILAAIAWALMAMTFMPTLVLYRVPAALGLALPAIAMVYEAMTLDSARRHWLGAGGAWKGRTYPAAGPPASRDAGPE